MNKQAEEATFTKEGAWIGFFSYLVLVLIVVLVFIN